MDELRKWRLDEEDLMVSFDVKSLFTNVPIDDVLIILMEKLQDDETLILGDRTTMDPSCTCICYLTELCLRSTYFAFQGQIFKQLKGTAMGSPLSPVVANIFMEDFETTALMTADHQPTIWKRYVDDTFVIIWPHGREKLEYFLHHINHLHKASITFTVEVEEDHKIAFLDIQIIRNNSTLETLVYHKPTHTNQYLNFRSHTTPESSLASSNALLREQEKSAQKTIRRES